MMKGDNILAMIELIKKLTEVCGVSGSEENIREVIKDEIKDYVDEIREDVLGNLIAVKKGSKKKIMLAAHMDEIGIIVTNIEDNGFLRFSVVGGVDYRLELTSRVKFNNGIIGVVYFEEKVNKNKNIETNRYFIDIGAKNKDEAMKMVSVGDTASFVSDLIVQNDRIISKALDDRLGCAVLISLIKKNIKTDNEIYYVFTVQEEVGARGAKVCAYDIKPDLAIAVDVTDTGDMLNDNHMAVALGSGVAIKIKDRSVIAHPIVKDLLINKAKENDIPYQLEILEYGGTDAGSIHLADKGVITGGVSIPTRYIHTVSEMADVSDIENTVKLLKCAIM